MLPCQKSNNIALKKDKVTILFLQNHSAVQSLVLLDLQKVRSACIARVTPLTTLQESPPSTPSCIALLINFSQNALGDNLIKKKE